MTIQNNSDALLTFIVTQANSGQKNWFGFHEQRVAGIDTAYKMAIYHADKMSPRQIAEYVRDLNQAIFDVVIKNS